MFSMLNKDNGFKATKVLYSTVVKTVERGCLGESHTMFSGYFVFLFEHLSFVNLYKISLFIYFFFKKSQLGSGGTYL